MRRLLFTITVLVVLVVSSLPLAANAATPVYVALGDSYTAGPFIPNQLADPIGCLRSDHNYPHRLATAIGIALRDASCSGATLSKLSRSQSVVGGTNPPQLSRLSGDTTLVTLQMGGNDIGFTAILLHCIAMLPFGTPCRDHYVRNGVDAISNKIAATAPRVDAALESIHARAPHARVLVLGYPAILPDSGVGCWPAMPFAWNDVPYLRARAKQLNAMLAAAAARHRATYVDVYGPSIGHDACASRSARWIEPFAPATLAAPVHPNAGGMNSIAHYVRVAGRL
jgi:lysophospholipase L1-like esterase